MEREIKNVALAGPSGNVGSSILNALLEADCFNITVLVRKADKKFSSKVSVKVTDFTSQSSVTEAVKGQDVVIDATVGPDPQYSLRLVDASLASGVYRFVPSEYTSDPHEIRTRSLPLSQGKKRVYEYLQRLASENRITYTVLATGAFLDWNLQTGFMYIDLARKTIDLLNDGTNVIPWTLLPVTGKAVVNALLCPESTKNRTCLIYNIQKSQREVADLAKEALGPNGWKTQRVDMEKVLEGALSEWSAGNYDLKVIGDFIRYSNATPGFSGRFETNDNELLGVKAMTDDEVKQLIKEIAEHLQASSN
ncbi:hypothetical protein IWW34DRAFT_892082 [Fusarium oxysporum f. sp. albedinis]|nr:hypothetical protein IWW34DRAFT_892082 [Fusarium oxysporum f. sp. albedinis]KAJ0136203.1 hypothetical protein HZ326_20803 [Fusarium oxysporum f. sp. albedinis]